MRADFGPCTDACVGAIGSNLIANCADDRKSSVLGPFRAVLADQGEAFGPAERVRAIGLLVAYSPTDRNLVCSVASIEHKCAPGCRPGRGYYHVDFGVLSVACKNLLKGYRSRKGGLTFRRDDSVFGQFLNVPCGVCRSCRVRRRLDWAIRCALEALEHDRNCVLTLTYRPEELPPGGGLVPRDLKLFLMRLRYFLDEPFRYFAVGEYGGESPGDHPHYHVLLFGVDFADRYFWKKSRKGTDQYRSDLLEKAWTQGFSSIGDMSWDAAQYVAGYVMKKITGEKAADHYGGLEPEFIRVSRMPGLGMSWYEKHREAMYEQDAIVLGERTFLVPRKFDDKTREDDPELWKVVSDRRRQRREELEEVA